MTDAVVRRSIIYTGIAAVAVSAGLVGGATYANRSASPAAAVAPTVAQMAVECEPMQRAIVVPAMHAGGAPTVRCMGMSSVDLATGPAALVPAALTREVAYTPAVYRPEPAPVQARAPRATSGNTVRRSEQSRSWQKRALVIGGSSGAGAGIGALIGGKKGALIGAAIGGGSGALYEVIKK